MGCIITLSGTSYAGKTTIFNELVSVHGFTPVGGLYTRFVRPSDSPLENTQVTQQYFELLRSQRKLICATRIGEYQYAVLRDEFQKVLRGKGHGVRILAPSSVPELKEHAPCGVKSFYILTPSKEVLLERIRKRGDDEKFVFSRRREQEGWDVEALTHHGLYEEILENKGDIREPINRILAHLSGA